MLGIAQNRDDATRCRYCGEKLSLLQRLSRAEYCNSGHKDADHRDQEKLALGRLKQVVATETRGIEARLARARAASDAPAGGDWPEEAVSAAAPAHSPASSGVTYDDPEDSPESGVTLCGPIYGTATAASGLLAPNASGTAAEDMEPVRERMPETALALPVPRVQASCGSQLAIEVPGREGDRRGRLPECKPERNGGDREPMRFPALGIQSVDWREAHERTRRSYDGIPPLAGLIQIAGPQTLRFTARLRTPMPLPETPAGNVVRAYRPSLAGGSGMPSLAGAIRGLGTWRTRFGSEGSVRPLWESDLAEMKLPPDWTPRYPVFYTTSPWNSEGLDQIFGLGPGSGPGLDLEDGDTPPEPTEVTVPVAIGGGTGTGGSQFGAIQSEQAFAQPGSAAEKPGGKGSGGGAGMGAGAGAGMGAGAGAGLGRGPGFGQGGTDAAGAGLPGRAGLGFGTGSSGGGGFGTGTGLSGPGTGSSNASGFGSADGRGVVSLEAVAALVKAARQSDRSHTSLRDVEIRLLPHPAAPRLAASQPWRGLREGGARDLPARGPILIKAPMEMDAVALEAVSHPVAPQPMPLAAPPCPVPVLQTGLDASPGLVLAPPCDWSPVWLRAVTGMSVVRQTAAVSCPMRPAVSVPEHRVPKARTGGAANPQAGVSLPEPWVGIQAVAPLLARAKAKPLAPARTEIRRPARETTLDGSAARNPNLELGRIERPNAQWVLLRGSEEAATFRLAIDALRLQEPGTRAAVWGPIAAHRPEASRAGVPPSRGLAFHDLGLQRFAAEPLLDPVICQFGSARGGQWGSQT